MKLKQLRYSVQWDCPHCGNSHNWWWEDKFEAYDDGETDMVCDRCDRRTRCVGDGNGFYEPVRKPEQRIEDLESLELDLHNYVRGLEDKVNVLHKQNLDAINSLSKRMVEVDAMLSARIDEYERLNDNLSRRVTQAELNLWRLENGIKTITAPGPEVPE